MRDPRRDNAESQRRISRRALVLGGSQLIMIGALGFRMRQMQVEQADQFRLLADENRIKTQLIAPARGRIYDRKGLVLAENIPSYRITITREQAGDVDEVIERLSQLVQLDPEDLERAIEEMKRVRGDQDVTIVDRVSWEDVSRVAANAPALPGINPEVGLFRRYPEGAEYSHILGYVGPVSSRDLERIEDPDPLLRIPRYQIGKFGLEAQREDDLRGKAGVKRIEVNAAGRQMRELDRNEGRAGDDMQITIDTQLQSYMRARMHEESAAAVVIDCKTGDLLGCVSAPDFDPNLFVNGISSKNYTALLENKFRPLPNKTVQGIYPPGSTFKMVTALAALEEGLIDSQETIRCQGFLEISERKFHCWNRGGHGNVNLNRSLMESCDIYYYDLALRLGIEKLSAYAKRLGLGISHDIPLTSVSSGLIPTREWKQQAKDASWVIGDTVNASIGQGFVLSSPLQLAVMTARLATGKDVTPRLVRSVNGIEQPSGGGSDMDFNENNLRLIRKAMFDVSNSGRGTAFGSRIITDAYRMAGKTGTSQVRNISTREREDGVRRNEDLPWEQRDHALFVNFAPYDDPKVAVAVIVEHGGGGSVAAAPIARDITLQALFEGEPPLTAYPSNQRGRIRSLQEKLRDWEPPKPEDDEDQT